MKSEILTKEQGAEFFRSLWKYIEDDDVTDIDYNTHQLWIKRVNHIPELIVDAEITDSFISNLANRISNKAGKTYNQEKKQLCTDFGYLRITCVHELLSISGVSMSIRKSLPSLRITEESALKEGYCDEQTLRMLINCVLAQRNFVFAGEPGKGKTECGKFLSSYNPAHRKVITIGDTPEWHYSALNPGKNAIEIKSTGMDMAEILATVLRLNPAWIFMEEARSREVRYLLEAWSNGIGTMTTLHVDDIASIPDRIMNMLETRQDAERIVNQVYNDVGVGVLLKEDEMSDGNTKHYISQVGFFYRKDGKNGLALVVEEGKIYPDRIPDFIRRNIENRIGRDIFSKG